MSGSGTPPHYTTHTARAFRALHAPFFPSIYRSSVSQSNEAVTTEQAECKATFSLGLCTKALQLLKVLEPGTSTTRHQPSLKERPEGLLCPPPQRIDTSYVLETMSI